MYTAKEDSSLSLSLSLTYMFSFYSKPRSDFERLVKRLFSVLARTKRRVRWVVYGHLNLLIDSGLPFLSSLSSEMRTSLRADTFLNFYDEDGDKKARDALGRERAVTGVSVHLLSSWLNV